MTKIQSWQGRHRVCNEGTSLQLVDEKQGRERGEMTVNSALHMELHTDLSGSTPMITRSNLLLYPSQPVADGVSEMPNAFTLPRLIKMTARFLVLKDSQQVKN